MKPEQTEITLIPKSGGLYSVGKQQQGCMYVDLLCGLKHNKRDKGFGECMGTHGEERGWRWLLYSIEMHDTHLLPATRSQWHKDPNTGPGFFVLRPYLLWYPVEDCELQQRGVKNNTWDNNTPGRCVSGQACHNPIILIRHYNQSV